jgi:putative transposase
MKITVLGTGAVGAQPVTAVIVEFIDAHREKFGVEPICEQLQVAPSTYFAHRTRPPSARSVADVSRPR